MLYPIELAARLVPNSSCRIATSGASPKPIGASGLGISETLSPVDLSADGESVGLPRQDPQYGSTEKRLQATHRDRRKQATIPVTKDGRAFYPRIRLTTKDEYAARRRLSNPRGVAIPECHGRISHLSRTTSEAQKPAKPAE